MSVPRYALIEDEEEKIAGKLHTLEVGGEPYIKEKY